MCCFMLSAFSGFVFFEKLEDLETIGPCVCVCVCVLIPESRPLPRAIKTQFGGKGEPVT